MVIHDYVTLSGKNIIEDYIFKLNSYERTKIIKIRKEIANFGFTGLKKQTTRQLYGKLWEIKVDQNRMMYVIKDGENIYFLHICKKQKGKAEKFELNKAIKRAKELDLL